MLSHELQGCHAFSFGAKRSCDSAVTAAFIKLLSSEPRTLTAACVDPALESASIIKSSHGA